MGKFALVLFPDEMRALQGFQALEGLHRRGSVCVRGAAIVQRDEHGLLSLSEHTHGVLIGEGLGAVVARAPDELLQFLSRDLAPGTFALVAEVWGEWVSPVDARMETFGGRVVCEWGTDCRDGELRSWSSRRARLAAANAAQHGSFRGGSWGH